MYNKKMIIITIFLFIIITVFAINTYVKAEDPDTIFDYNNVPSRDSNNRVTSIDSSISNIWSSILLILQIASVTAVILAGVRYMYASADQKADIKKSMIFLVSGAVIVFASSTIIKFVIASFTSIVTPR